MSIYSPPTEDVAIFDTALFKSGDEFITQSQADKRYLRFPNAQGTENLQAINVNGLATFNNNVDMYKQLNMASSNSNDRVIISTYYNMRDLTTANQTGTIYSNNGTFAYINNVNSGSHEMVAFTSSGTQTIPVIVNSNGTTLQSSNNATTIPTLNIKDTISLNNIVALPNASAGALNPAVTAGNQVIAASGTNNTENLILTTQSSTNSAVKIGSSSVELGVSGTGSTGTTRLVLSGGTITAIGTTLSLQNSSVVFTSSTAPTSSQTLLASNDSSTKMPTTLWVQNAIDAKIPASLLGLNNTWTGTNNFANTAVGSLTSGATQPAATDSSTKVPTTAWVQSAISAAPLPQNATFKSVTIQPIASVDGSATSYLSNVYNLGGVSGLSGTTTQAYSAGGWSPSTVPSIQFRSETQSSNLFSISSPCLFELTMFYYSGGSYGQTTCNILLFPSCVQGDWGTPFLGTDTQYSITNSINGNSSFTYSSGTYAPSGRQYWTFNQQFSGVGGAVAYLRGSNISTGIYQVSIWPLLFNNTTTWSWSLKCLNSNGATTSSSPTGIVLAYS